MKETEQTLLEIPDIISALSIPSVGPTEFAQKCRWLREQMDAYATAKAKASCEATLMRAAKNGDVDTMEDDKGRLYILQSSILDPSNIVIL